MEGLLLVIFGAVGQGMIWGIMALGVYITFRMLDFADLTVDGSFATGGCVAALFITLGIDPIVAVFSAAAAGAVAGLVTGFLHTKCQIPAILAGILTQLGLYSINLRIMGRSNLPLLKSDTLIKQTAELLPIEGSLLTSIATIAVGLVFTIFIVALMYWFFGTELGSAIRATGNNENMVRSLGVNTNKTKVLGLMISNALIALSGALVTQSQGYGDVKMGMGAIVIGLASIIIGEMLPGKRTNFALRLCAIIGGSIIYRLIVAGVLKMGLDTDDLKLLTSILIAIALTIPVLAAKHHQKNVYKANNRKIGDWNA